MAKRVSGSELVLFPGDVSSFFFSSQEWRKAHGADCGVTITPAKPVLGSRECFLVVLLQLGSYLLRRSLTHVPCIFLKCSWLSILNLYVTRSTVYMSSKWVKNGIGRLIFTTFCEGKVWNKTLLLFFQASGFFFFFPFAWCVTSLLCNAKCQMIAHALSTVLSCHMKVLAGNSEKESSLKSFYVVFWTKFASEDLVSTCSFWRF